MEGFEPSTLEPLYINSHQFDSFSNRFTQESLEHQFATALPPISGRSFLPHMTLSMDRFFKRQTAHRRRSVCRSAPPGLAVRRAHDATDLRAVALGLLKEAHGRAFLGAQRAGPGGRWSPPAVLRITIRTIPGWKTDEHGPLDDHFSTRNRVVIHLLE